MRGSSGPWESHQLSQGRRVEPTYDVIVVGFGYAGAAAALAAAERGARVALFEKGPHPGGTSILSSGSAVAGREYHPTRRYLEATSGGETPTDVLDVMAHGMVGIRHQMQVLARRHGLTIAEDPVRAYPFPGADQLFMVHVRRAIAGAASPFGWTTGVTAGATLFRLLYQEVVASPSITVFCATPVVDLVTEGGEVAGVIILGGPATQTVRARQATVLCTGGFEGDRALLRIGLQCEGLLSIANPLNTGDGVRMTMRLGARLWHMWHVHGSYAFQVPGVAIPVRHPFGGWRDSQQVMGWIAVDRTGRRFMNEYPYAPADTPIRHLLYFDPERQWYPRIPSYLIFDDAARMQGPVGAPRFATEGVTYTWSPNNAKEVASGVIARGQTLEALADRVNLPREGLTQQVAQWNASVGARMDAQFGRPPGTMHPVAQAPFYAIAAWPAVGNTQGGPAHDAQQRVVRVDGQPIRRLYAAGELGSLWDNLYLLGGNITECLVGGRIAGERAAEESPRVG